MKLHYEVWDRHSQRHGGAFDTWDEAEDYAHSLTWRVGSNRYDVVEVDEDSGTREVHCSAYDGNYDCHFDE